MPLLHVIPSDNIGASCVGGNRKAMKRLIATALRLATLSTSWFQTDPIAIGSGMTQLGMLVLSNP